MRDKMLSRVIAKSTNIESSKSFGKGGGMSEGTCLFSVAVPTLALFFGRDFMSVSSKKDMSIQRGG